MKKKIAAFGFRSIPPQAGCAGADKFAEELFTRLVQRGFEVTAYNRAYEENSQQVGNYKGIKLINLKTVKSKGFDTLLHSLKATWHIITHNTGDIVHIQNGGNSIWSIPLRLFGKKVFISQDGVDWKRDKWPWYGKLYLYLSTFLTARAPNAVIFDNIFAKELFEQRFHKTYNFIPFGSEVSDADLDTTILDKLNLTPGEYFLFVGRFIPDKGLQYLIPAFEKTHADNKLVLVGGSPNPSDFETQIKATKDQRIVFPGYVYGRDVHALMKNAYAYIQPSDIEGLSPVILENMGLQTPVICSDIKENIYVVEDTALSFKQANIDDLAKVLRHALDNPEALKENAIKAKKRALEKFSWEVVTDQHIALFMADKQDVTTPA
jgi:glycosyltransferase involved in cell wall biosynthesis